LETVIAFAITNMTLLVFTGYNALCLENCI